jgi:L-aminopeptidase/D-esterase-like protein
VNLGGCLTDVAGVRVGHAQRHGGGWCTGTTVVLLPDGTTAGVDVRGGGPGTRETDLLHPLATMPFANAICLTGGSAYGLAAAGGVMAHLEAKGIGFPVGANPGEVVPIVPGAVIFDLGRGGRFTNRPDESFGAGRRRGEGRPCPNGSVGTGARSKAAGRWARLMLPGGTVVAALAVVNSAGSVIDPDTGLPWMPGAVRLRRPPAGERAALRAHFAASTPALNTTIGVVATTATLTKAEAGKLAAVARRQAAIRPVHHCSTATSCSGAFRHHAGRSTHADRARFMWPLGAQAGRLAADTAHRRRHGRSACVP